MHRTVHTVSKPSNACMVLSYIVNAAQLISSIAVVLFVQPCWPTEAALHPAYMTQVRLYPLLPLLNILTQQTCCIKPITPFSTGLHLQSSSEGIKGPPSSPPTQPSSEDTAQLGPFRSPPQPGHPQLPTTKQPNQQDDLTSDLQPGAAPFRNADSVAEEPAQPKPQASAPYEDNEKQIRCMRALLERAMLGPPLPDGDAHVCSSGVWALLHLTLNPKSCDYFLGYSSTRVSCSVIVISMPSPSPPPPPLPPAFLIPH